MPRKEASWEPSIKLERYFKPSITDKTSKNKVRIKNHNLPILQYMYNGDERKQLYCLVSGEPGWKDIESLSDGKIKQKFNIDFNHIRQELSKNHYAGFSKDRSDSPPSTIFRSKRLDSNLYQLLEFMTIVPICQEYHRYITQDSQSSNLTLENYRKSWWPWFLKRKSNFNKFCDKFDLNFDYFKFVDHLSNIKYPSIFSRINNLKNS